MSFQTLNVPQYDPRATAITSHMQIADTLVMSPFPQVRCLGNCF